MNLIVYVPLLAVWLNVMLNLSEFATFDRSNRVIVLFGNVMLTNALLIVNRSVMFADNSIDELGEYVASALGVMFMIAGGLLSIANLLVSVVLHKDEMSQAVMLK